VTPGPDIDLVARVRHANDASNRGDFDAAMEYAHPEVELVRTGGLPPIRGADAVREWLEPDAFESQEIDHLDYRVAGNRVLVHSFTKARGAGSGIDVEIVSWSVWTCDEDGLITRIEIFLERDEAEALRAAGLGPPSS
jgi:hypothetical protein